MTRPPHEDPPPRVLDYAAPQTRAPAVRTYLGQSIVAVFFVPPLGLVALCYSILAERALRRGDRARARSHGGNAALWGMAALFAWLLALVSVCFIIAFARSLL